MNSSSMLDSGLDPRFNTSTIAHLTVLSVVALFGTIGNTMTLVVMRMDSKLRKTVCNYFIVNLAFADFMVCSVVVPVVVVHEIVGSTSTWDTTLCYISAAISGLACHGAAITMTCISMTRFIAARHPTQYKLWVIKRRVMMVICVCWLFSAINTLPIMIAWFQVSYDPHKYVCICFDGTFPLKFTLGPVFVGHFVPHAITVYCYTMVFKALGKSRRRTTELTTISALSDAGYSKQDFSEEQNTGTKTFDSVVSVSKWSKHEIQMFKTSVWVIGFFSFCWIPYGVLVLLQDLSPILLKRIFGTVCLLSFSLNPVIYGVMSSQFRKAYKKLFFKFMWCFTDRENITNEQRFPKET